MRAVSILTAVLGVAGMAALVGFFGLGEVLRSLGEIGAVGFAAICVLHLLLTVVMGLAWRALLPGSNSWVVVWGRLVRDSASEVLPLSQVGGYVVGFHPVFGTPRGASGMWLMRAVALCVTSLLLMGFYLRVLKRQGRATVQSSSAGP